MKKKYCAAAAALCVVCGVLCVAVAMARGGFVSSVEAAYRFGDFQGRPPIHVYRAGGATPQGMTPAQIKKIYRLPAGGGTGTIAIIDAYDAATIEKDLGVFDSAYGLP